MKYPVSLLCAVMAAAQAATPTPIDPAAYTAPIRVACVGDSITAGVGADPGKSYPSQLQAILGPKWDVQNFGKSGRTMLKKGDFPYWTEPSLMQSQAFKPNVVIIMLGTNDAKPQNWMHGDQFSDDYKDMINIFKRLESKPRIFICHPCAIADPGYCGILVDATIQVEIPLIDKLAAEENVDVIDLHTPLAGHPELQIDRVHPNTAGASVLAQTVFQALTGTPFKTP